MPRLYWKEKSDNLPNFGLREQVSSTPGFQKNSGNVSSTNQQILHIQEDRIPPGLPSEVLKIENHSSNIPSSHDYPLETFRAQLNGHHDKQSRASARPIKALVNGHVRTLNSPSNNQGLNVSINSPFLLKDKLSGQVLRATTPKAHSLSSVFDESNLADEDILAMAAQRDQQRGGVGGGGGARYIRGMMGPISSKFDESRSSSGIRRSEMAKSKLEKNHGSQDIIKPMSNGHIVNRKDHNYLHNSMENRKFEPRQRTENIENSNRIIMGYRRRPNFHLDYLNDQPNDILAQSVRRQSLKGSKYSLSESNLGNIAETTNSPLKLSRNDSDNKDLKGYSKSEPNGLNGIILNRRISVIPSSHEDIQILNLQGFMDFGRSSDGKTDNAKKKNNRRRNKGSDAGGLKMRERKRRIRGRKMNMASDDEDNDEVVLKDIDDIDDKISGLVLGPKVMKEAVGEPISVEDASKLRTLLMGSPSQLLPVEWMTQSFIANTNSNLSYGLVQKKGGPCGVLASVQAHMMKALIFGSHLSSDTTPVSPLRPSSKEWAWALSVAFTELLWRAGGENMAILALPGSFAHFDEHGVGRYNRDGVTETLSLHYYYDIDELFKSVIKHLTVFTAAASPGCVLLLYSLLLSRGLDNVFQDMDAGGGHLINMHGYASQEVVNLMLTGKASTNTFDGDKTLEDEREVNPDTMVFKGVQARADIGMLSLFEHYGSCKVGAHLKTPLFPIWVVCSESHYSCLFSRDLSVTNDNPKDSEFTLFFYDGLALQEDEIKLTISLSYSETEAALVPPLEHCIRTKWPDAAINWNGTDPIL